MGHGSYWFFSLLGRFRVPIQQSSTNHAASCCQWGKPFSFSPPSPKEVTKTKDAERKQKEEPTIKPRKRKKGEQIIGTSPRGEAAPEGVGM